MNHDDIHSRYPMPVPGPDAVDASRGLKLEDVVAVLRRRLVLIGLCVILAISGAIAMLANATPRYVASAEMLLGGERTPNQTSRDLVEDRALNESALQGEIAVLQSTALLVRVADRLDLDQSPEFNPSLRPPEEPTPVRDAMKSRLRALLRPSPDPPADDVQPAPEERESSVIPALLQAAEAGTGMLGDMGPTVSRLRRSLSVSQRGTSYVVRVTASSEDPVTAAAIANAVVDEYVAFTGDRRFAAALRYTGWLETRVTELAQAVEDSETAVLTQKARAESDVDSADRLAQQMQEMTSKLVDVRATLSETKARASEASKLLQMEGALAASGVLESPTLTDLDMRMADLRREREDARRNFSEGSPRFDAIDAEIAALAPEITLEVERVIGELEALARVQEINAEALTGSLAALERRAVDRSLDDIEINQLERIADANRRLYEDFLDRFKQSSEIQNLRRADAEVISYAGPPSSPATPRTRPTLVLAAAGGLFAALALAFALELLPARLRTAEDVRHATDLRTFGELPRLPGMGKAGNLASFARADRAFYRFVRAIDRNLRLILDRDVRSVLFVGAESGGDKSMSALLLARSLAEAGSTCLIVDADTRAAALSRRLVDPQAPGLLEVLHDGLSPDLALAKDGTPRLSFLPCRVSTLDPATLFASARADALFDWMLKTFDVVVIDGPPLDNATDIAAFTTPVDAALYVLPAGKTKVRDLEARAPLLSKIRASVEGTVLSRRPRSALREV
jgi:uncharacterized protein involved in exopolysaccharide biosynthesis